MASVWRARVSTLVPWCPEQMLHPGWRREGALLRGGLCREQGGDETVHPPWLGVTAGLAR